jgi:hypothetical protein
MDRLRQNAEPTDQVDRAGMNLIEIQRRCRRPGNLSLAFGLNLAVQSWDGFSCRTTTAEPVRDVWLWSVYSFTFFFVPVGSSAIVQLRNPRVETADQGESESAVEH